jgi:hypothetical protein
VLIHTQERVRGFRKHYDIAVFRDAEWAERDEITLEAAAKLIGVCQHDGAAYASPRRDQRPTSLRRRALGDQG